MKTILGIILVLNINFFADFKTVKQDHNDSDKNDFKEFLELFSKDSTFQMNHIAFPLKYTSVDIEDNKEESYINKENWELLNFDYNPEIQNRETDAYQQFIEVNIDSAKVLIRGIDNGINIDFQFLKTNGSWTLTVWNDNSV